MIVHTYFSSASMRCFSSSSSVGPVGLFTFNFFPRFLIHASNPFIPVTDAPSFFPSPSNSERSVPLIVEETELRIFPEATNNSGGITSPRVTGLGFSGRLPLVIEASDGFRVCGRLSFFLPFFFVPFPADFTNPWISSPDHACSSRCSRGSPPSSPSLFSSSSSSCRMYK